MSAAIPAAKPCTLLRAPVRLHGTIEEQILPKPWGEAYRTVGAAAAAAVVVGASAPSSSTPSTVDHKRATLRWGEGGIELLEPWGGTSEEDSSDVSGIRQEGTA